MWETVQLGDVCEILDKLRKPITKKNRVAGDYPYYGATGIVDWVADYIFEEPLVLIGEDGAKWEAGAQTAFIADGKYWVNNHAHVVKPHADKMLNEWLAYYLSGLDLKPWVTGLTVPKLNQAQLKLIPIPLPPLAEQKRIVAKLDAAFAEIDTAIAVAEKNAENARAIINSSLGEIFQHEADDWDLKKLSEVCKVERGSSPRPIKQYLTDDGGVNWIKIGDTEQDGKYVTTTKQKITEEGAKKSRQVTVGDFILTNSMSYGRPYIMGIDGYIHDGWFVLRLNKDIDTDYFYYLLTSPYVQNQFHSLAAGAVVKNISGDLVKKTLLPIPSSQRQKEICEKITAIEMQTQQLAATVRSKLSNLVQLKSALLTAELAQQSEAA